MALSGDKANEAGYEKYETFPPDEAKRIKDKKKKVIHKV
jgi:hypothetical protein